MENSCRRFSNENKSLFPYARIRNKKCKFSFSATSLEIKKGEYKDKCQADETSLGFSYTYNYPKKLLCSKKANYDIKLIPLSMQILHGIYCIKYCPHSAMYMCGYGNGRVELREETDNKILKSSMLFKEDQTPVASICFHPLWPQFIFAACSNGKIYLLKKQSLSSTVIFQKHNNEIHSIDVNSQGNFLFSAGQDGIIRMIDISTKTEVNQFEKHTLRIFCVKYDVVKNVIISGGWDRFVYIWDPRMQDSVQTIKGPCICGETIDIRKNMILTGSWVESDSIQLWDLSSTKLINTFRPGGVKQKDVMGEFIYSCKFCEQDPDGDNLIVGKNNSLEILNWMKKKVVEKIEVPKPVQAIDDKSKTVVFGGIEPFLRIVTFNQ